MLNKVSSIEKTFFFVPIGLNLANPLKPTIDRIGNLPYYEVNAED
jgi:hypothetical protein